LKATIYIERHQTILDDMSTSLEGHHVNIN